MTHFAECVGFLLVFMAIARLLQTVLGLFGKNDEPRGYFD
jgi:hypothetical protein